MTTLAEKIAVMQAFERGEKIENRSIYKIEWDESPNPTWAWDFYTYRVAETKPEPQKGKIYCFFDGYELRYWHTEHASSTWMRVPSEDKEVPLP